MIAAERIPVIAAIGEVTDDKKCSLDKALDPITLMANALNNANFEAGERLLDHVDSVDVVNQISWAYTAPADALCDRLGITPRRRSYGVVGGETPIKFLQGAAERIARGESSVAAICGGEAHRSVAQAERTGATLPWPEKAVSPARSIRSQDLAHRSARLVGVDIPVTVYPLFENAQNHALGLSPGSALLESGRLWSHFSRIAAENPYAVIRRAYSPEEIITPSSTNRMLAWPFTKLMVANIAVNQGAAVIVASLAAARRAGLDDGRLLFFRYGNSAEEATNFLARDRFDRNHSRDAVLEAAQRYEDRGFDAIELYSCFPCVPKAARRTLGLSEEVPVTVTGGLTFFGAPLNNYMSHATCAMVRRLRARPGRGLLYGQGGVATKHRCLILDSAMTSDDAPLPLTRSVQAAADARRGIVPPLDEAARGCAEIETYTVIHDRDGNRKGVVIARTPKGTRCVARVVGTSAQIDMLETSEAYVIGTKGRLHNGSDGIAEWGE